MHAFTTGGDYKWNEFTRTSVAALDQRALGLFIQDEWIAHDQFMLMTALRYDKVEDIEEAFSPKVSLMYIPVKDMRIRASVGRGFHAPTLQELYEEGYGHGCSAYRFGNPDLDPELGIKTLRLMYGDAKTSKMPESTEWKLARK